MASFASLYPVLTIIRFSQDVKVDLIELEKVVEAKLAKGRHGEEGRRQTSQCGEYRMTKDRQVVSFI